jgi:hypothetical protein
VSCVDVLILDVMNLSRNDSLGKNRAYPEPSEALWLAGEKSFANLMERHQIPAFHDLNSRTSPITVTHIPMASRRLALNLTQGLRNRAALNAVAPLKRGFATPVVKNGVKTESTTLANGLTVRTESRRS